MKFIPTKKRQQKKKTWIHHRYIMTAFKRAIMLEDTA